MQGIKSLHKVSKKELKHVINIFIEAFGGNYTFYGSKPKKRKLKYLFKFLVLSGYYRGTILATSPKMEGASIWIKTTGRKFSLKGIIRKGGWKLFLNLPFVNFVKLSIVGLILDIKQKKWAPGLHWYLKFIAIKPEFQGKGFANFIIQNMLYEVDKDGLVCYLETQNPNIIPFYEKYGFEVAEKFSIFGKPTRAVIRKPQKIL
ncbi:MAG: GNAT family N-acetyltransferase [Candidatus Gracilibacteria bacterium]|nr:GNAT family N-acetyltransferase [Candidatus Gracilibacteria bacterium]